MTIVLLLILAVALPGGARGERQASARPADTPPAAKSNAALVRDAREAYNRGEKGAFLSIYETAGASTSAIRGHRSRGDGMSLAPSAWVAEDATHGGTMILKAFPRTILTVTLVAGAGATALAQIPLPPPPPLPGLEVHITTGRPPALRHEVRGPRPGSDYLWIGGFWHSDGGRWIWVPGRWERPAATHAYWISPRYVHTEGGYIYEPGHWSTQTVVVGEDVRRHRGWRKHEREHERELERERNRDYYRDQYRDR
jgi:hypothetical protein